MRTLQEKYNAIQEGKFSKEHFLAEARMQQPQLITRFNGYDDAVQILKNKGMIIEAKKEETVKEEYSRVLELPDGNYFAIDGDWEDQYEGNSGLFFTVKGNSVYDKDGQAIQSSPREFISQFAPEEIVKVESVNEARLTKNNLTDYRYKPTNEMDKYPYEQILRGIRVELEALQVLGTPTAEEYAKALAKVSKNLAKDSIFYTNQLAGVNPKVDLHDKMVDATAKNTVDTFNGMKKAALKESHSKNPDDKYMVKTCGMEGTPWAVWEGKKRVKGFATKAEAKEYADKQNKKQGLSENILKEGIKNLIKKVLSEGNEFGEGEDIYEMYGSDRKIPDDTYIGDNTWYDEEEDEIDYDDENFSDPFIDGDLDEAIDTEADKNMVRKLMLMYETDPAKFAKLHKQAQTQASTTRDIKFKHLLSLFNRAKAGASQKATPEIPGFKGTRDALDDLFESDKFYAPTYITQKYGAAKAKEIEANIEDEGANTWDLFTSLETPKEVDDFIGGFTMDESVSLFDILDENHETDPYDLNDKTDYRKMGAKAFYDNKKRNQNPYPLDSPAGIDWDKGWDKAQSAESDSYKGY